MVEFVSANPTGPLHVGHGRQAALGDAIATLLEWQGCARHARVLLQRRRPADREPRAVGAGARAAKLLGEPGDVSRGRLPRRIHPRDRAALPRRGRRTTCPTSSRSAASRSPSCARSRTATCRRSACSFDHYYLESSLYTDGRVDETVEALAASGQTYESEGALWLRTTDFGDDKDRVMRKSDGSYTYFVPDVAYHVTKWERGFARAVNVQGADHHARSRACAPGCRRSASASRRAIPTTCCTRW